MESTSQYFLEIHKKNRYKVISLLNKIPSSRFAIIDERSVNYVTQFKIAITQKDLFILDDRLSKLNINHKFSLI